jgi:hypothetical protein
LAWLGFDHRSKERDLRFLQRCWVTARGRFHCGGGDDLHEVIDHDISQRTDWVVEVAAVLDAKAFGHSDLNTLHVIAVPDRFKDGIGEPEIQDLLEPHLSEVVIDPVQLVLIDVLV